MAYFVVPAPGCYGDRARVFSSHRTLAAARKAAGNGCVVRVGDKCKGDVWLRVYEQTYPLATRHGATQPEGERVGQQLKLRLSPEAIRRLKRLATRLDCTMSDVVVRSFEDFAAAHEIDLDLG